MKREWRGYPPSTPKKPPPEHGIKMKRAGTTWWGERWIDALVRVLRGGAGRLSRGRTYARAGRAHDLVVAAGTVTAKVTGSREEPYEVAISLAPLEDEVWSNAIAGMAAEARFAAELLAGRMPEPIDEMFAAAGASLFPRTRAELTTRCSCPDWGDPCKHVAATHYVLGEAFDRDPFLLFELRGRSRDEVLDGLRAARGAPRQAEERPIDVVSFEHVTAADYDRAPVALPTMSFSFEPPIGHAAVLRQLGAPSAWHGKRSPADAFAPVMKAAAARARAIAMKEPEAESLAKKPRKRRTK